MSRTRLDLELNNLWSAHKFKDQAPAFLDWLETSGLPYKLGRSCIHVGTIKLYPHWKGKSNSTLTLVKDSKEVATFDCHCKVEDVINCIKLNQ